jgi:3-oxoacyl-[acyl-carrier protein] reductase
VRACLPGLKASGDGAIVNVSSIAGTHGIGSSIAYAASKGALNTMTKSLARALAPAVRVNAVCPGFVATRWFSDAFGQDAAAHIAAEHKKLVPLDRIAAAEDIADVVLFFAGRASRHVTGELLLVDGGLHLTVAPAGFR